MRVVAELVRHLPSEDRGLSALGQALTVICQLGIDSDRLILAAQLLDDVSRERAVVLSLILLRCKSAKRPSADRRPGLLSGDHDPSGAFGVSYVSVSKAVSTRR